VEVDFALATFEHLIKGVLEKELGYTDEISVSAGDTVLYDPEFDDNLEKKLSDFGISNESIITVKDENDPETRVNLEVLMLER
jgi:ubiquitin-like 1-activating enzyme E1 B